MVRLQILPPYPQDHRR